VNFVLFYTFFIYELYQLIFLRLSKGRLPTGQARWFSRPISITPVSNPCVASGVLYKVKCSVFQVYDIRERISKLGAPVHHFFNLLFCPVVKQFEFFENEYEKLIRLSHEGIGNEKKKIFLNDIDYFQMCSPLTQTAFIFPAQT